MRAFTCFSCLFVMLVLPSLSLPAHANDITVESKLKSATVYSDRATLTRNAKVEIPKGAHNLVFTGLPINLDANSLRVNGSSEANVIFGALTYKRETSADFVVPRFRELNAKIVQIKNSVKVYEAEKQALTEANSFLQTWGKQANLGDGDKPATIHLNHEKWVSASDGLSSKILANLKGVIALDVQIEDAKKEIKKIQKDLKQLKAGHKQSYTVIMPFESDEKTTLNVDLSYQTSGGVVGWAPIYDARLDVKSNTVELTQYGSVWQRTGEDWEDIELTLSTAQPSRGTALPGISPQWLSIYEPPTPSKSGEDAFAFEEGSFEFEKTTAELARSVGMSVIPAPIDRLPGERLEVPEIEAGPDGETEDPLHRWRLLQEERVARDMKPRSVIITPSESQYGYVGEYKIAGPATVKSDGTKVKLLIGEFETDSTLEVQMLPHFTLDAYIVAKTKLKGDVPLLPGLVHLFRDGTFIGQVRVINMIRPNEEVELSFGIDDNIVLKRNVLKDESGQSGLITKERVIEKHFINEIQNLHKESIQIAILEIVPTSKDTRVRVEIINDKTTPGYETDFINVKGATLWTGTLEPQQKTAINIGWKVSWPNTAQLSGL